MRDISLVILLNATWYKKTEGEPFWLPFNSGGKDDFGFCFRYVIRYLLPV